MKNIDHEKIRPGLQSVHNILARQVKKDELAPTIKVNHQKLKREYEESIAQTYNE